MTDTLKTCLLTGRMALPDGGPVREASVDFALTRPDWEGTIMPPERVSVPLDASGCFTTPLWPNVRGAQGSRYKVQMRYRAGAYVAVTAVPLGEITVPDVAAADLADLLDLPPAQPGVCPARITGPAFDSTPPRAGFFMPGRPRAPGFLLP